MQVVVARAMWALPLLLIAISVGLVFAALDIRSTLQEGEAVQARVIEYEAETRAEITYGHVEVEATLADGRTLREDIPLPISLLYLVEGQDEIAVRVSPGSDKPIVIEPIARAQWRLSLINAAMSLFGAVLLIIGVGAWNRYLKRQGDPAAMPPREAAS